MTFTETFKVFEGDKFMHVKIKSIDPQTNKKIATEVKEPINFEKHLSEEIILEYHQQIQRRKLVSGLVGILMTTK